MQEQDNWSALEELSETPSWDDFYEKYVRANRPVVLRSHTAKQPAYKLWTDEYLVKHWGKRQITAEIHKTEVRGGPSEKMSFKRFLKEIYLPQRERELYAVIDFESDAKAKADFKLSEPLNCKEILPQSLTLWMSAGGTTSVLHQDDAENILMQLAGTKSVMLVHQDQAQNIYAPEAQMRGTSAVLQENVDLVRFPRFADVKWLRGQINPGDTLYIPHTYWHQVNSKERNLAANLWWQHADDWRWFDKENRSEYDALRFGQKSFPSFEALKSRSAKRVLCTALPDNDMTSLQFKDETWFAKYARKMRKKARKDDEL